MGTTTVTSPATEATTTALAEDFGILVIGGSAYNSVELFSPAAPEEGSCHQEDYPIWMSTPTSNFVAGQLVACYFNSCEKYNDNDNSWTKVADTRSLRVPQLGPTRRPNTSDRRTRLILNRVDLHGRGRSTDRTLGC